MKTVSILLAFGLLCSTVCGADLTLDQTSTTKSAQLNNVTPPFVPASEPIAVQASWDKDEGTEKPVKGEPGDSKIGSGGLGGNVADGGTGGWTGDVAKGGSGDSKIGSGGLGGNIADGGTGGWTGDVAKGGSGDSKIGSGGLGGNIADGGSGGWTGDVAKGGSGGGGGGIGGTGR
jgi:hypothetical protein